MVSHIPSKPRTMRRVPPVTKSVPAHVPLAFSVAPKKTLAVTLSGTATVIGIVTLAAMRGYGCACWLL